MALTAQGEAQAGALAGRLAGRAFALVLTSPRTRARETARLAGFPHAEVEPDLAEWDYGDLEGRTTDDIRAELPGWTIWSGPVPGGETAEAVRARCDRLLTRLRIVEGDALLFSHGHLLRTLAARWIGLDVVDGSRLGLDTATVSRLGHERETPVVSLWNERAD